MYTSLTDVVQSNTVQGAGYSKRKKRTTFGECQNGVRPTREWEVWSRITKKKNAEGRILEGAKSPEEKFKKRGE